MTVFFFCGCSWCREVAEEWAKLQHGKALPLFPDPKAPPPQKGKADRKKPEPPKLVPPVTLVVFSGTVAEARDWFAHSPLDPKQTTVLADPDGKVTNGLYHADTCPRVFVLDAKGKTVYTNDHADDKPREAPALVIAAKALTALRGLK